MRASIRGIHSLPFFIILALLVDAAPPASAQTGTGRGRISGTVTDESGAAVEGALVTASSLAAGVSYSTEVKTNKKGRFALAGFDSGTWRITVSKAGFYPLTQDIPIHQLQTNPPLDLVLKKATGLGALQTDQAGMAAIERGDALLAEGKYAEAAGIYEEFLAKYPEIYQARLNLATALLKQGDTARAETEFKAVLDKALPADPGAKRDGKIAVRALSGLGETALKTGDFESARTHFARVLEISPQDEAAAYNVGEIFFSNQDNDGAIRYFEMAARIKSSWPKPYYRLGLVYLNKGDYAKALENLKKFIELDPQNPEAPNVKNIIATIEKMNKQEAPE